MRDRVSGKAEPTCITFQAKMRISQALSGSMKSASCYTARRWAPSLSTYSQTIDWAVLSSLTKLNNDHLAGSLNLQLGFLRWCSKCAEVVRPSLCGRAGIEHSTHRKFNFFFCFASSRRTRASCTLISLPSKMHVVARDIRHFPFKF